MKANPVVTPYRNEKEKEQGKEDWSRDSGGSTEDGSHSPPT